MWKGGEASVAGKSHLSDFLTLSSVSVDVILNEVSVYCMNLLLVFRPTGKTHDEGELATCAVSLPHQFSRINLAGSFKYVFRKVSTLHQTVGLTISKVVQYFVYSSIILHLLLVISCWTEVKKKHIRTMCLYDKHQSWNLVLSVFQP